MTVSSQAAVFSTALQPGKYGSDGALDVADLDYFKMRAVTVNFGEVQDQPIFPLEVGGPLTPDGTYKQAFYPGGVAELIPRLEDTIGYLLLAAMGQHVYASDQGPDGAAVGVNRHTFRFNPDADYLLPWLSVRVDQPTNNTVERTGKIAKDCRVNQVSIAIPAMGKVMMNMTMVGREMVYDNNPSLWQYVNANFEDSFSSADAGRGSFKINGEKVPAMGLQIEINNGFTTPRQEMVIGSFHPDDFMALSRSVSLRFQYKYENDDLNRLIHTSEATGTQFNSLPYVLETAGGVFAMEATFQAPMLIGATIVPYTIRFRANRVTLASAGSPELSGGGFLVQNFMLTVLEPTDSSDYFTIELFNDVGDEYTLLQPFTVVFDPTVSFTEVDDTPQVLDAAATVTHFSDVLTGGKIIGRFGTATSGVLDDEDHLIVAGAFTVDNVAHTVSSGVTLLATSYFPGRGDGQDLTMRLTSNVTPAVLEDLLQAIAYVNDNGTDSTTNFPVTISLVDGEGNETSVTTVIDHA